VQSHLIVRAIEIAPEGRTSTKSACADCVQTGWSQSAQADFLAKGPAESGFNRLLIKMRLPYV